MSSRKLKKKDSNQEPEAPSKLEYEVAKYLRFNLRTRQARLVGMTVNAFIASNAVDLLMETDWASGIRGTPLLFSNRPACVAFCDNLLQKGLYHRAMKISSSKEEKKKKKRKEEIEDEKKRRKEKDEGSDSKKSSKEDKEKDKEEKEKEKPKRKKLKLEMHDFQTFVDGDEVYVWIYDPMPLSKIIIGILLVVGAVVMCLYPLWPEELRLGVYYLSLAAMGFVGLLIFTAILRGLLFCSVFACTLGKTSFWLFPNYFENCGFFESFVPVYECTRYGSTPDSSSKKKKKKQIGSSSGGGAIEFTAAADDALPGAATEGEDKSNQSRSEDNAAAASSSLSLTSPPRQSAPDTGGDDKEDSMTLPGVSKDDNNASGDAESDRVAAAVEDQTTEANYDDLKNDTETSGVDTPPCDDNSEDTNGDFEILNQDSGNSLE